MYKNKHHIMQFQKTYLILNVQFFFYFNTLVLVSLKKKKAFSFCFTLDFTIPSEIVTLLMNYDFVVGTERIDIRKHYSKFV